MPQITQLGQVNIAALNVPDLIVQIIPPQLLINGVPSNIVGFVGTASWGPTNVPQVVGGYTGGVAQFGYPNARKYDLMTAVWAATQQGAQAYRLVRVTDGTDTAASAVVQTNCFTVNALYTGTRGNKLSFSIGNGSQLNSFRAVVAMPGQVAEVFDNISAGVTSFTVTAGSYTVCPTLLTIGAPTMANGVQAVAHPQLVVTGTPTVSAGGSGYLVNDQITLSNGVVLKVATVTTGAVSTVTVVNPGAVNAGQTVPTNPVAQTSTTGTGTGATFSLTWGLGQPVIETVGSGYTGTPPTVTIVGGTGTGGSLAAVISVWTNMANAINNGISGLRGPSQFASATAGAGTANPTLQAYTLSGGTDGANATSIGATGTPALVGQDALPRTGMYAMRSALISIAALVDCDDPSTYTSQVSFGESEGIYMIMTGPNGENLTTATGSTGNKATYGIDNFTAKLMFGDWIYINDPVTGAQRMISPQAFVAGFMGNQSPSETPMNKAMNGIVGTQKSKTGLTYTNADLQALSAAGIDVICNPNVGGNYFGLRLGINTSSNLATNGDNYTRMTYFIARTIAAGCGKYVGQLQTKTERLQAATTLAAFFEELKDLGMIGTADGSPCYQVVINDSDNPQNMVALGYQVAYCKVIYLSVIRYFVIDLEGGQTVTIQQQAPNTAGVITG